MIRAGLIVAALVASGCADDSILGTWDGQSQQYSFSPDGKYEYDFFLDRYNPDAQLRSIHYEGRYELGDGTVSMLSNEHSEAQDVLTTVSYYVGGDELWLWAHRPVGVHDGVVGTWMLTSQQTALSSSAVYFNLPAPELLTLTRDSRFRVVQGDEVIEGQYSEIEPGVLGLTSAGGSLLTRLTILGDDEAFAGPGSRMFPR